MNESIQNKIIRLKKYAMERGTEYGAVIIDTGDIRFSIVIKGSQESILKFNEWVNTRESFNMYALSEWCLDNSALGYAESSNQTTASLKMAKDVNNLLGKLGILLPDYAAFAWWLLFSHQKNVKEKFSDEEYDNLLDLIEESKETIL